ncbi:MAG: exosortase/archaeosortase family protein [Planctomycetes bacterium]|nr:exosortase/archaeosortase family protein [Planctomycetota bacterium]
MADAPSPRTAAIQITVLSILCVLVFLPAVAQTIQWAGWNPEAAHALAVPVALVVIFLLRRHALAAAVSPGSNWGLALILFALVAYFFSSWPFNYGIPQRLSIVPALAGCVLVVGGWRLLWRAAPLLLIITVSIPPGTRYYARLIILPETETLAIACAALDMLPGVLVEIEDGMDMVYMRGDAEGVIAKGISNRGASQLMSSLMVGVIVTFARIRPRWQIVVAALAAAPIMLLCNLVRVIAWGAITIYTNAHTLDQTPRYLATALSLVLAWALFGLLFGVLNRFVIPAES